MSDGGATAAPAAQELSRESIARTDPSDQLADVLALPEHLRDALWRVESAIMNEWDTPGGLVVAGMGGSAIGGSLACAALGDHASRPIFVTRAYGLPPWTTPETTVLCASYSGNTEETLACYESAGALGAQRVVVTTGGRLAELARADKVPVIPLPGGFQPRAARDVVGARPGNSRARWTRASSMRPKGCSLTAAWPAPAWMRSPHSPAPGNRRSMPGFPTKRPCSLLW